MSVVPVVPRNPFTDLIDRVAEINAGGGGDRQGLVESVVSSNPAPTVRSSSFGTVPELSPEEKAERDAKLVELGILPPPEPVEETAEPAPIPMVRSPRMVVGPAPQTPTVPRLPNFARVQGINLILKVVHVDGMDFPISEKDAEDLRIYAMETARNFIINQFNAVFATLVPATAEAKDGASGVSPLQKSKRNRSSNSRGKSTVQPVPEASAPEQGVSSGGATGKARPRRKSVKRVGGDSN